MTAQFILLRRMGMWWPAKADASDYGWSGSRWVRFGDDVQVCNFCVRDEAISYMKRLGFLHAPELEPDYRQLPTGAA